jgi:hypothetical protein
MGPGRRLHKNVSSAVQRVRRAFTATRRSGLQSPRLVIFLIPLPEALPFPHHAIYSFVSEPHDDLTDCAFLPIEGDPPLPDWTAGRLFTSLRLWQALHEDEFAAEREHAEIVRRVGAGYTGSGT